MVNKSKGKRARGKSTPKPPSVPGVGRPVVQPATPAPAISATPSPAGLGDFSEWLTTLEAAERLGLSQRWIRTLVDSRRLESVRRGRVIYVRRDSVERYGQERAAQGS